MLHSRRGDDTRKQVNLSGTRSQESRSYKTPPPRYLEARAIVASAAALKARMLHPVRHNHRMHKLLLIARVAAGFRPRIAL